MGKQGSSFSGKSLQTSQNYHTLAVFTQNRSHLMIPVRDGSIKEKEQTPRHSNHPMLKHPIESPNSGKITKKHISPNKPNY